MAAVRQSADRGVVKGNARVVSQVRRAHAATERAAERALEKALEVGTSKQRAGALAPALTCIFVGGGGRI